MAKQSIIEEKKKTVTGKLNLSNLSVSVDGIEYRIEELLNGYDRMDIKIVAGNKKDVVEESVYENESKEDLSDEN